MTKRTFQLDSLPEDWLNVLDGRPVQRTWLAIVWVIVFVACFVLLLTKASAHHESSHPVVAIEEATKINLPSLVCSSKIKADTLFQLATQESEKVAKMLAAIYMDTYAHNGERVCGMHSGRAVVLEVHSEGVIKNTKKSIQVINIWYLGEPMTYWAISIGLTIKPKGTILDEQI